VRIPADVDWRKEKAMPRIFKDPEDYTLVTTDAGRGRP